MNNFESLKLTEKQRKIINDYLETLKSYVKNNKIDIEVYNDIEEMFLDKLFNIEKLDELQIKKSIKEVWKIEDIFSDYSNNDEIISDDPPFYEKLIYAWWTRDNDWAVLLWISKTLANKIWISILAVRILLVLLIFIWWISAWLYILAWVILPVKWISYADKWIFSYLLSQILVAIKNLVSNFTLFFIKYIKVFIVKILGLLRWFFLFIAKNIFPVFRFIIFLFLSILFLSILIGLITVWAFFFSDFSIYNIEFFSIFPSYFIWWIVFWIISSSLLTISSFIYWIRRKGLNFYFLSTAWISFLIALFLNISTLFSLTKTYFGESNFIQELNVDIIDSGTGTLNIDISKIFPTEINTAFSSYPWLKFESSTWSNIKIIIDRKIIWNDIILEKITKNLNDIKESKDWNTILLRFENDKVFKNQVPFTLIETDITFYLPTNKEYLVSWHKYYFTNVTTAKIYWNYNDSLDFDCKNKIIFYSFTENKFVCKVDDNELKSAKNEYIKWQIINRFNDFTTIKHLNKYKDIDYWRYGLKSDWSFDNIYFVDDDKVNIDFSDKSLEINSQVEVTETAEWIEFSNFKINNVNANYSFKEKYYIDTSSIEEYINEEDFNEKKKAIWWYTN